MRLILLFAALLLSPLFCLPQEEKTDLAVDLMTVYHGNLISFYDYASTTEKINPYFQEYYLFLKRKKAVIIEVPNGSDPSGGFGEITAAKVKYTSSDSLRLKMNKVWMGTKNSKRYERDYRFRRTRLESSDKKVYHFQVVREENGWWLVDEANNLKFFTNGADQTKVRDLVKRGVRCLW